MNQKDQELKEFFHKETEIPQVVQEKANQAFRKIEAKQITQEKPPASLRRMKVCSIGFASAAAVFLFACLFCISNPVMAKDLPLVGHLFERLQEQVSFFGNFSDVAVSLEEKEPESDPAAATGSAVSATPAAFTQTSDGLTVTLSEIYANQQAAYITMLMETETDFPDILINQQGNPSISMTADTTYDFGASPEDPSHIYNLEGRFLDDQTYSCILRLDLQDAAEGELPSSFSIGLDIEQIYGFKQNPEVWDSGYTQEELEAMSDEEWAQLMAQRDSSWDTIPNDHQYYIYQGSWNFDIPVTVDTSRTQLIEVNDVNDAGLGIESILLTPYELEITGQYPEDQMGNFFLVALDADGNRLPYNESDSSTNNFAIQDRDISTIQIFILDYVQYMDELKGEERYNNNESKPQEEKWETLLKENAKYSTTLHLDKIQ
ncbi:MAG TPA: DUF4179 domain-containing protein [Candidatus Blautia avistercoris]|nr:DUF4179 domain-containing protein [Candidatus Blautia avistercoris]